MFPQDTHSNNAIDVDPHVVSLVKLSTISPTFSGPIIAVDLDDVLSQTNEAVSDCKLPRNNPMI
jgi:hypothetical protein